ncbi:MAG: HD domain-containing protein, partial [Candidatus Margulisiibacteriota bacterium]
MVLTKLDLPKSLCLRRGVDYYFSPQRRLFLSSSAGLDVKVVSDPRGYFVERLNLEVTSKAFYLRAANFYRVLSERMEGMFRLNGEPEINHLARIFNMMRGDGIRDEALLLAALGHDAIEDGYLNYSEIAEYLGKEAADLIEGETKLSREIAPQRREVGSLVKWIEAAHKDPRIIILKAYDNFDNWRDQEVFFKIPGKENRPFQHAEETMLIYGPILRYALGFWQMWVCLEDRALKYFDPEYKDNIQLYNSAVRNSFDEIERVAAEIQKELQMNQIKALVRHQVKHYSEIFSKAKEKNLPVKSLLKSMPLFVHYISVVVDGDLLDCHRARGIVDIFGGRTGMFFPETWGINNLIKARGNGYRALH